MTDARVVRGVNGPAVRLERRLADPPAVVWEAITERSQLRAWFPCDVEVRGGTWVAGAAIMFTFPPDVIDMSLAGEVLEVVQGRVLAYTWGPDVLRFELRADGDGTLLVLIDELPASAAARNAAGWDECLDRLSGTELRGGSWRERFSRYVEAFEPALGAQEGPPARYGGA